MKNNQKIITKFFPNAQIIKKFELGMSNHTYLIEINQKKYVFRIPIKDNSHFVSHHQEQYNLKKINSLNINQKNILYLNNGIKISLFIEDNTKELNHQIIIDLMKKLHFSNLKLTKYNHLHRLKKYEKINVNIDPQYYLLKNIFTKKYSFLKKHLIYPCHNDFQKNNLINNDQLYLIDWEFAGMNDYIYDLCCYTKRDINQTIELLQLYCQKELSNDEIIRIHYWSLYQNLQWYLVALYKHHTNFNPEINFQELANLFLNDAQRIASLISKYHNH